VLCAEMVARSYWTPFDGMFSSLAVEFEHTNWSKDE